MYESVVENLKVLANFAVVGFILALFYEFFRILRIFIRHNGFAVGIEDFLFLCFAGLITFAYSMEFGTGEFRMLFVFAGIFGATIYFISLGAIIFYTVNKFANAIRLLFNKIHKNIIKPFLKLIYKIIIKFIKKIVVIYNCKKKDLKFRLKMMYNKRALSNKNRREGIITAGRAVENKTDGKKNVIKAKIRKKT